MLRYIDFDEIKNDSSFQKSQKFQEKTYCFCTTRTLLRLTDAIEAMVRKNFQLIEFDCMQK